MTATAQRGTALAPHVRGVLLIATLAACGGGASGGAAGKNDGGDPSGMHDDVRRDAATDDSGPADAAAGSRDAGDVSARRCVAATDCRLVHVGCCAACEPTRASVVAVHATALDAERERQCPAPQPACGPCQITAYHPLAPELRADCVAGTCAVIDLREQDEFACDEDAQCSVSQRGACDPCSGDPRTWTAWRRGVPDRWAVGRSGACPACATTNQPLAYCAADGHCALRARPSVSGQPSDSCFSPEQLPGTRCEPGAVGCDCYDHGVTTRLGDEAADEDAGTGGAPADLLCGERGRFEPAPPRTCD